MTKCRWDIYLSLSGLFGGIFILFTLPVLKGLFIPLDNYIDQLIPQTISGLLYIFSRIMALLYVPLSLIIIFLFFRFVLKG